MRRIYKRFDGKITQKVSKLIELSKQVDKGDIYLSRVDTHSWGRIYFIGNDNYCFKLFASKGVPSRLQVEYWTRDRKILTGSLSQITKKLSGKAR